MVRSSRAPRRGTIMAEMMVAMSLLVLTVLPLSRSFLRDQALCRAYYTRATATEIVDGEMEVLRAGGWRACTNGVQAYHPRAGAVASLPPGQFLLTLETNRLRLDWVPAEHDRGGQVVRIAPLVVPPTASHP